MLSAVDLLAQDGAGGSNVLFLIMIVGFIALMYFVMIRPQRKRQREQQDMQNKVDAGARVMTIGGLHGTVVDSDGETVTLEASDDVFLVFARQAIARVLPAEEEASTEPEAPIDDEDATLTDEDLEKLRSTDDDGDDKNGKSDDKHTGKSDRKEY